MNTTVPQKQIVLFARISQEQHKKLKAIAKEKKIFVNDVIKGLIDQDVSVVIEKKDDQVSMMLANIENILVAHSKQTMEEGAKLHAIVTNIYATVEKKEVHTPDADLPEGIFLIAASKTDKKGDFYCQACGVNTSNKKKHIIQVQEQQVKVGDCCYFNDKYKELIRAML